MTRKELLEAAMKATTERGQEYGKPEDNFKTIASFWSVYLGKTVTAHDVAMMMVLFKTARAKSNPEHTDNLTDIAGYAACAAELEEKGCNAVVINNLDNLEVVNWEMNAFVKEIAARNLEKDEDNGTE